MGGVVSTTGVVVAKGKGSVTFGTSGEFVVACAVPSSVVGFVVVVDSVGDTV